MNKIDNVLYNLPEHWNKKRTSTLFKIINAITSEMEEQTKQIERIDSANGIDTAIGIDLDNRWGKILNIERYYGESDEEYRKRLKISISVLVGGTAEAIKFAVCNILNTNNTDKYIFDKVNVMDAWEYSMGNIDQSPGNAVCIINIDDIIFNDAITNDIMRVVNKVKASGVKVHFIFIITYDERYEMNDILSDNDEVFIDYPSIEPGFTTNKSTTGGEDIIGDGSIWVETCGEEVDVDMILTMGIIDESHEIYRPRYSVVNQHTLNETLYTSADNDECEILGLIDYHIDNVDLGAGYNDDIGIEYHNIEPGFILNHSYTNTHIISDNSEHAIICLDGETIVDTIIEAGKPDIIIKY